MRSIYDEQIKEENRLFASFLANNGLVQPNDIIVEYAHRVEDSICVNTPLDGYSKIIYSGHFPQNKEIRREVKRLDKKDEYQVNFICNGFNNRIKNLNQCFATTDIFNLGICSLINGEYTFGKMELVKYERELQAKGIKVEHIESLVGENSMIYLLTNRGFRNER